MKTGYMRMAAIGLAACLLSLAYVQYGEVNKSADLRQDLLELGTGAAKGKIEIAQTRAQLVQALESVQERVLQLPDDASNWHSILILSPDWRNKSAERTVEAMFHTDPLLSGLKRQTHWHLITTNAIEYAPFQKLVKGKTPYFMLEMPNGEIIARHGGEELMEHLARLPHALKQDVGRRCKNGRCTPHVVIVPGPAPVAPAPPAAAPAHEEEVPAALLQPESALSPELLLLGVAMCVVGAVAVVVMTIKKDADSVTSA